jgi:transcriptional regulator with XRE-family HTH domain
LINATLEYILGPVKKKMPNGIDKEVFLRLKKIRGNLSQEKFAKVLGVNQGTVCKYESGRLPDAITLNKIAEYGGVTVEWLLHGDATEPPAAKIGELAPEIYDARPVAPLDFPKLIEVVDAVEDYYRTHRLKRRSIQKSRLIALVYEHCTENKERPDQILVERYLPLAD